MELKLKHIAYGALLSLTLSGCGSDTQSGNTKQVSTGVFIDAAVSGLDYISSSDVKGRTDENGTFNYNEGDTITFSMGNIVLGSATATSIMSPYSLFSENTEYAINLTQLLMTLDADESPENGIDLINSARLKFIQSESIDFTSPNFDNIMQSITSIGNALVTNAQAITHLDNSLAVISGNNTPTSDSCTIDPSFDYTAYETTKEMLEREFSYTVDNYVQTITVDNIKPSIYLGNADCNESLLAIIDVTIAGINTVTSNYGSYDGVIIYIKAIAKEMLQSDVTDATSVTIYMDMDGDTTTGMSIGNIGADYRRHQPSAKSSARSLEQWNAATNGWQVDDATNHIHDINHSSSGYSLGGKFYPSEIYIDSNDAYDNNLILEASQIVISVEDLDDTGLVTKVFGQTSAFNVGYFIK